MVDAVDSKSTVERRAGSSPASGTTLLFFKSDDIQKIQCYKGFSGYHLSYAVQPRLGVLRVYFIP